MHTKSSVQRFETKHNVVTDYPNLGLHSSAAHGNAGGVRYALQHGQPVNSVLNGLLPIHAAASSGNADIVAMLIDHGADVNAPRLSRRFDRSRQSGPAVGSSGATALVFAAANGHLGVIELLLARGARWNVTDKNGATPAAVAVHHGQTAAAELLQRWAEAHGTSATGNGEGSSRSSAPRGLSLLPSFSSVSLQSLGQGSTTSRSLAHMRSLDALPHNHGSARPANLSRASSVSNVAVDTSSSASSFRHAPAPASAIGPRGTMHRQFSSPLVPQAADTTSHLPSSTPPATSADASRDWRRPSVSSVMERMAGSALKNAFKAGGAVETPREAGQKLHKSASKTSLSKVIRGRGSSTDVSGAGDEAEQPKRRSSFDVARKLADRRTRSATSPVSGAPSDSSLRLDVTASDSIAPPATSAQSQSTFVPHSASVTSLSAAAAKGFYRPRKSSQLSGPTRSAEDYEGESDSTSDEDFLVASPRRMRDEPDFDSVRPAFTLEPSIKAAARARARSKGSGMIGHPQVSLHHRSSSGGSSGSGLSSALPSPPLSRRNTPADRDGRPAPPFGGGDDADREEADPSVHGWDEASKAEATDRFPAEMPRFGHQRTGSNRGRERADSASSVASSGSPAVTASGPWPRRHGTDSNQQLDGSRTDSPTRSTRPSRSGSLSTDGGPNQISVASTTSTSPASLNSVLSGQASSVTGATSNMSAMGMLSPVYEDRSSTDAAGARAERPSPAITISAEEAHARVKKAERDLLNFNLSDANGRKMSLSDSLAAYGDSLNLEDAARALEAKRKKGSESASPAYTWETLSKDGSRTTVDARGERRVQGPPTRVGLSPQGPPSFLPLDQRNGQRSLANKKNAGVPAIAVPTSDKSTSGDDASRVSGFGSQKGRDEFSRAPANEPRFEAIIASSRLKQGTGLDPGKLAPPTSPPSASSRNGRVSPSGTISSRSASPRLSNAGKQTGSLAPIPSRRSDVVEPTEDEVPRAVRTAPQKKGRFAFLRRGGQK